jgi:hypothetical protein
LKSVIVRNIAGVITISAKSITTIMADRVSLSPSIAETLLYIGARTTPKIEDKTKTSKKGKKIEATKIVDIRSKPTKK